jgi:methyltransferase
VTAIQIILGAVLLQRLAELWYSRRNTERLLDAGAVEIGAAHYPYIVLLHAAWLAALVLLTPDNAPVNYGWLAVFLGLQAARVWILVALGRYWTTRVLTLPGTPLVRRGPYRYMHHPNYVVVAGEIAVLPLVFGQWQIALLFSALNLLVIRERIRVENEALAERRTLN